MEYLCNRYHTLMALIVVVMQLFMHWNIHFKHSEIKDKIDNYVTQERNARLILSQQIDDLEHNIKSIMDDNLMQIREEIEYNMHVIGVISEMIEVEHDT